MIYKTRLLSLGIAGTLLVGCAQNQPQTPVATPAPEPEKIERTENVCPVIRFLVAGAPAEQSGYDVKEAITATRQLFREQGLELVTVDRLLDRFQSSRINLRTPLANDPQSQGATSAQMDESVRKSIRNALETELSQFGEAEIANCEWILTGQVDVGKDQPDPQGPSRIVNVATWLTIVEGFTNRGVGDAFTFNPVKGPDAVTATRRGMVYSLESVAGDVGDQIRDAATLYTILVRSPNSARLRSGFQRTLEGCGFAVRSAIDGEDQRRIDAKFDGTISDAEAAVGCALDTYEQQTGARGGDYTVKGRLLAIDLATVSS